MLFQGQGLNLFTVLLLDVRVFVCGSLTHNLFCS